MAQACGPKLAFLLYVFDKIRSFLFIVILASSILTVPTQFAHAQGQVLCASVFADAPLADFPFAQKILQKKDSSVEAVLALKQIFLQKLIQRKDIDTDDLASDVQQVAFFEAYGEYTKQDFFKWLSFAAKDPQRSAQFFALMKVLDFTEPVSQYELRQFIYNLYQVSNPPPPWWKRKIGATATELWHKRVDQEDATQGLFQFLRNLGITRDDTFLEKIKSARQTSKAYTGLILPAVLNTFWIHKFGMPLYIPQTHFSDQTPIGADKNYVGWAARTDAITGHARRALNGLMIATQLFHFLYTEDGLKQIYQDARDAYEAAPMVYQATKGFFEMYWHRGESDKVAEDKLKQDMQRPLYQEWARLEFQAHQSKPDPLHNFVDRARWNEFLKDLPD